MPIRMKNRFNPLELKDAFSRESYLQRQVGMMKRPTRLRHRTRHPGGNRFANNQLRFNNTRLRVNSYNLVPCVFDGPFLSICYNNRPVCRTDEILCKKDTVFCCYKPLCDLLPETSTTDTSISTTPSEITTLDPVDYCTPYGSYILVCTEPNKFPECPTDDPDVSICKLAKPFSDEFVYCCHKPMDSNTTTIDLSISTESTSTDSNLNYECEFMG